MKILVILGSPKRNGSGLKAAKRVEEAMAKYGDVEFEYLSLIDHNLGLCRGCFLCISKGEDLCPMSKDRESLQERMEAADGIILVSPSYVQDVSWLMKNLIDRFAFTHHRPILHDKRLLVIANGGAGLKRVRQSLAMAIEGPQLVAGLDYMTMPWPMSPNAEKKRDKAVKKAADTFYRSLQKGGMRPTFSKYLMFRFFKDISDETVEHMPADHRYYSDKVDYHYPVAINPLWKVTAGFMVFMLKRTMADMAPYKETGPETEA